MKISERFLKVIKKKSLKKGEHYILEGNRVNTIAYIESGFLRTYQIDYRGDDVTTNLHAPKSFCGSYYGFYSRAFSIENIVAISDVELKLISYEKLMSYYENDLEANIFGREMIEKVCIEKDIRISKLLKLDAEKKYLWFVEAYPEFVLNVPVKYIASYLGMKKETISRIRKKIRN